MTGTSGTVGLGGCAGLGALGAPGWFGRLSRLGFMSGLGWALLLGTGCARFHLGTDPLGPHPDNVIGVYPIGIYAARDAGNLPGIAEAGFNLVTGPARADFLDAAGRVGLRVLTPPGTAAGDRFDPAEARRTVRALDRHPALWAWYLSDEPDLNGVAPEAVERADRVVRRAGARRPTALVVYRGVSLARWHEADILMVDRYPVGWQPLATFFQNMQHGAVAAGVGGRRFMAVIQAFDWSRYADIHPFPEPIEARAPTHAELRCMAWGARVIGADGLFFYCYDDGRWDMSSQPETWAAVRSVVGELRARQPLLHAGRGGPLPRSEYLEPSRRFNEVLEPALLWTSWRVDRGNAAVPAGEYWVLVNTTGEHHQVRITDPSWWGQTLRDLDAPAPRGVDGEGWMDPLTPYEVRLLGPLPSR